MASVDRIHPRAGVPGTGRSGTFWARREELVRVLGPPDEGSSDEKVTAQWWYQTPHGPAGIGDYWWNTACEWSIWAADRAAADALLNHLLFQLPVARGSLTYSQLAVQGVALAQRVAQLPTDTVEDARAFCLRLLDLLPDRQARQVHYGRLLYEQRAVTLASYAAVWAQGLNAAQAANLVPEPALKRAIEDTVARGAWVEAAGMASDDKLHGTYDFHTATCAEIPHVAVYQHEGEDGDETRIADVYIREEVSEAEELAIKIVELLNRAEDTARAAGGAASRPLILRVVELLHDACIVALEGRPADAPQDLVVDFVLDVVVGHQDDEEAARYVHVFRDRLRPMVEVLLRCMA